MSFYGRKGLQLCRFINMATSCEVHIFQGVSVSRGYITICCRPPAGILHGEWASRAYSFLASSEKWYQNCRRRNWNRCVDARS